MKLILEYDQSTGVDSWEIYCAFEADDIDAAKIELMDLVADKAKIYYKYDDNCLNNSTIVFHGHTINVYDLTYVSTKRDKKGSVIKSEYHIPEPNIYTLEEFWEKHLP